MLQPGIAIFLLAGNHGHFFRGGGGEKLLLERRKDHYIVNFPIVRFPGAGGGYPIFREGGF